MKTYKFLCLSLACAILMSCSKSEESDPNGESTQAEGVANYTLLVKSSEGISGIALDANSEVVALSAIESTFEQSLEPALSYKNDTEMSFYKSNGDCSGTFIHFNFEDESTTTTDLFSDLGACILTVKAIAQAGSSAYVAYTKEQGSDSNAYFIRTFDFKDNLDQFSDITLSKQPLELIVANNKLVVLTMDLEFTKENYLTIINPKTNATEKEIKLGYDALRIFRNSDQNIIVGYEEIHTIINSTTYVNQNTRYQAGKEPNFINASVNHFGKNSKMYYNMPSGVFSNYPEIPAVFDFSKNLTTLYPFENYLSPTERNEEFKIQTTTMVGYDETNGYLLIGYKKNGSVNKGGLLRIRIGDMPAFIDNFDVDGIPMDIFVN